MNQDILLIKLVYLFELHALAGEEDSAWHTKVYSGFVISYMQHNNHVCLGSINNYGPWHFTQQSWYNILCE